MTKTCTLLLLSSFVFITSHSQQTIQKILYHEYNKADVTNQSQEELNDLVRQLHGVSIISVSIRSYADKNGTSAYNKRLSEQRSLYVLKTLQGKLRGNISYATNYFGEDNPVT